MFCVSLSLLSWAPPCGDVQGGVARFGKWTSSRFFDVSELWAVCLGVWGLGYHSKRCLFAAADVWEAANKNTTALLGGGGALGRDPGDRRGAADALPARPGLGALGSVGSGGVCWELVLAEAARRCPARPC